MHAWKTGERGYEEVNDFQSGNIDIRRMHIFMGPIKIGRATRRQPRRKNRKNFTHARETPGSRGRALLSRAFAIPTNL